MKTEMDDLVNFLKNFCFASAFVCSFPFSVEHFVDNSWHERKRQVLESAKKVMREEIHTPATSKADTYKTQCKLFFNLENIHTGS